MVADNIHANPYTNLTTLWTLMRPTVVGGLAVYGDQDIMTALKGGDTEPAGKFGKAVDVLPRCSRRRPNVGEHR